MASQTRLNLDFGGTELASLSDAALDEIECEIVQKLMHPDEFHPTKRRQLTEYYNQQLAKVVSLRGVKRCEKRKSPARLAEQRGRGCDGVSVDASLQSILAKQTPEAKGGAHA